MVISSEEPRESTGQIASVVVCLNDLEVHDAQLHVTLLQSGVGLLQESLHLCQIPSGASAILFKNLYTNVDESIVFEAKSTAEVVDPSDDDPVNYPTHPCEYVKYVLNCNLDYFDQDPDYYFFAYPLDRFLCPLNDLASPAAEEAEWTQPAANLLADLLCIVKNGRDPATHGFHDPLDHGDYQVDDHLDLADDGYTWLHRSLPSTSG